MTFASLLLIVITAVLVPLYYSGFVPYHAFARCPNGTHKSPSGACEQVAPHEGLSRCPNGFHRSPSGNCEAVNGNSNSETSKQRQTTAHINNAASSNIVGTPAPSSSLSQCDQTLWNHVYNPTRFQIADHCKTVTGSIESIKVENDGDLHIRLRVDPQFASMINTANVNGQFGDLVLEPVCQNPVTQPDAIAACANFHQNINIPPVGTHVTVTGSYVLDQDHGCWAEIHPVTSILQAP